MSPVIHSQSMLIKLVAFNARYIHSCPALFHVREELGKHLPRAGIILRQYTINDPYYPTLQRIREDEPDVVCFSVSIWNSFFISRLVRDLAAALPAARIILGGPQAASLVAENKTVLPDVTVVRGEIEGVGGSFYQDLAGNRLQALYEAEPGHPFASPYQDGDFADGLKNRHIYYESSRGCPFACTYCLSAARPGVRRNGIDQVRGELDAILGHEPRVVRFVDRTFNDRPDRALAVWRFLAGRGGKTLFHFEVAPDRFTDEMFDLLAGLAPGRFQFEIGIQSTNPETLAAIHRKMDLEATKKNVARLAALDTIHIHADLILGLPHDTRETFARSFRDVFSLAPHYIQMGLLKVLPDTPISRSIADFNMVVCQEPPYEILANRWLDRESLADLYWFGECVEAFYNNRYFPSLWKYLRSREEDVFAFFVSLLALCRAKDFFDRAATQEVLSGMLLSLARHRDDERLVTELLAFDWLRTGHRFLPGHLQERVAEQPQEVKNRLWKDMPQNLERVYDYKGRDEFFKRGAFMRFSGQCLAETGSGDGSMDGDVCFTGEREKTVAGLCRVVFLPE